MEKIQFIGLKDLEDMEKAKVQKFSEELCSRSETFLDDCSMIVHIKGYNDNKEKKKSGNMGDKRKKYDIIVRVVSKQGRFEASGYDWDISKALHKAFNAIKNEIKHKMKI